MIILSGILFCIISIAILELKNVRKVTMQLKKVSQIKNNQPNKEDIRKWKSC